MKCFYLIFLASFSVQVWASSDPFSGIAQGLGLFSSQKNQIFYSGYRTLRDDPTSVQFHRFQISSPILRSPKETYSIGIGASQLSFDDNVTLPKTNIEVPRHFEKYDFNLNYTRLLEGRRFMGLRTNIGVASNKPFRDPGDTTYNVAGFYSFPGEAENLWVLSVFMSNNSPILNYIPIPGFFYLSKKENFVFILGIPLAAVVWTPQENLKVSASAFGPALNFEVSEGDQKTSRLFGGFNWTPQSYLRFERDSRDSRLYFVEKKVFIGFKKVMSESFNFDFQVGRAFDRKVYESKKYGEFQSGSAKLKSVPFVALNLNLSF